MDDMDVNIEDLAIDEIHELLMEAGAETVIRRWADLASVLEALAEWSEDA